MKDRIEKVEIQAANELIEGTFYEKVDENTPPEMLKSDKFERGDRVNWLDKQSGQLMAGTLWIRNKVVFEMSAEDPYDPGHNANYWCWTIYGDDGCAYGFREEYLVKE